MIFLLAASPGDTITDAVAEVAKALRYPVLILALIALAAVVYEIGRLALEFFRRSQRTKAPFDGLARKATQQAQAGDSAGAQALLREYAYGSRLQQAAVGTMFASNPIDAQRAVIDYDLYISKRLDRVRLLVRSGPALGLMGTLIPLAPALAALGNGDAKVLADELQTAFAITVVGVAIGLLAFTVALVRERFYTKDLADLEFLREIRGDSGAAGAATARAPQIAGPASTVSSDQSASVADAANRQASGAPIGSGPAAATSAPAQHAAPAAPQTAAEGVPAAHAAPTVPAIPAAPLAAEPKKKKFGIKKKQRADGPTPSAAATQFPPPPPPPVQPAAGQPTVAAPTPASAESAGKSPSVPTSTAPAESGGETDGEANKHSAKPDDAPKGS